MTTARPSRRLSKAPLVYTLAQVQFTPVAKMRDVVADIQADLREIGYPRFEKIHTQRFQLGPQGPKTMEFEHWEFGTTDNRSALLLREDMIVFQTTKYTKFEDLSNSLRPLLEAIKTHAKLEIGLIKRIAIRYTDVILLKPGEKFSDLLKPGLIGPFCDNEDNSRFFLESQRATADGTLAIRCMRDDSGIYAPNDLMPLKLLVPSNKKPTEGQWSTVLDYDHFSEDERPGFDVNEIIAVIDKLHNVANNEFFSSLTEKAKTEWA